MTPAGSQRSLSGAQQLEAERAVLGLQPRRVVAADGVVVGDRRARGGDRVAGGALGALATGRPGPSRSRAASTVKYSEAPVGYRCETWQPTTRAAERAAQRARRPRRAARSSPVQLVAVSSVSTSTPRSSRSSRRYGPGEARARPRLPRPLPGVEQPGAAQQRGRRAGGARRSPARRPPSRARAGSPRRSRARAWRPSRRAAPAPPGPASARLTRVSVSSDSRATSGARPVLLEPPQRLAAVGERAREPALVAAAPAPAGARAARRA